MKILFSTYPMAFHTPGGGEMQLLKYKEYLGKKGVQVDFFDLWNPNFRDYDIFHFFSCISGSNHICNFVKRLDVPVVISSSLWLTEANKNQYPCNEIRAHLSLADRIVTNSVAESKKLSSVLDMPIDLFEHVYNGVDPFFCKNVDPEIFRGRFDIHEPFILNVGNIEQRKNQLLLAQVAEELNITLVLIGHIRDTSYADEIFRRYQRKIKYIGPIEHSELLTSAYAACDVFCLPSFLETPGLAALEAAACGASVVVTSEGSTFEYFGDTAIYVNPHSKESIKTAVQQALISDSSNNSFNADKFYWDRTLERLLALYSSLI